MVLPRPLFNLSAMYVQNILHFPLLDRGRFLNFVIIFHTFHPWNIGCFQVDFNHIISVNANILITPLDHRRVHTVCTFWINFPPVLPTSATTGCKSPVCPGFWAMVEACFEKRQNLEIVSMQWTNSSQ